jgi:hypothetical protein
MNGDEEFVIDAPERVRIESVRDAIQKVASMLAQEWFYEEVAGALAHGMNYEARLVCKRKSSGDYTIALARGAKPKSRDTSFNKLELE